MTTITQELERTARDIATAPSFRDSAEIAIAGGTLGALLGYIRYRNKSDAMRFAWWGVGLGIAGQYMVFHMLKPAMKQFGRSAMQAATIGGGHRFVAGAPMHGGFGHGFGGHSLWQQQLMQSQCAPGFGISPLTGQCTPLSMLGFGM